MMRSKISLILMISLLILQSACSKQATPVTTQVVTVVVTSVVVATTEPATVTVTPTSTPIPSETPELTFTSTEQIEASATMTATPFIQPSPTELALLTARIEGDPQKIIGTIYWPDYGEPISMGLDFWVRARNPAMGSKNGAGITSIDFVITDKSGTPVYSHPAKSPPFCAFGSTDQRCNFFSFADHGFVWPKTNKPIQNGPFTLTATVNAEGGDQWSGTANFRIRLP